MDSASDREAGRETLTINQYDLLLDLILPQMNGMDILKQIRSIDPNMRILILSARDRIEDRVNGLDLSANDYLFKSLILRSCWPESETC